MLLLSFYDSRDYGVRIFENIANKMKKKKII